MTRWILALAWAGGVTALSAQAPPAAQLPPGQPQTGVPPAPTPTPAPTPAVSPALWQHLVNWETVMKGATNFYCEGKKVQENKVGARKGKKESKTDFRCQMPSKARMLLTAVPGPGEKADANDFDLYIATGTSILEYDGNNKRLIDTRLPPGGTKGMLLLDFLSGAVTARAAVERFEIRLLQEDANYLYLELKPRTAEDLGDFESMILVLFRNLAGQPAYLPRQVVVRRNKDQEEETWDFPRPAINVKGIANADFEPVVVDKKIWNVVLQNAPAQGSRAARPPVAVGAAAIPGSGAPAAVPTPGGPPRK